MSRIDRFTRAWDRHHQTAAKRRALRQQNPWENLSQRDGGFDGGGGDGGCRIPEKIVNEDDCGTQSGVRMPERPDV